MADNYTQFCIEIPNVSKKGRAFLRAHHANQQALVNGDYTEYPDEGTYEVSLAEGNTSAYVFSTGDGSPEAAVNVLAAYLKACAPEGHFILEWANTCSKSRPGEFGGGAALITATKTTWFIPGELARRLAMKKFTP